jgi:hypothetical protein
MAAILRGLKSYAGSENEAKILELLEAVGSTRVLLMLLRALVSDHVLGR